jgi:hypothetical protein
LLIPALAARMVPSIHGAPGKQNSQSARQAGPPVDRGSRAVFLALRATGCWQPRFPGASIHRRCGQAATLADHHLKTFTVGGPTELQRNLDPEPRPGVNTTFTRCRAPVYGPCTEDPSGGLRDFRVPHVAKKTGHKGRYIRETVLANRNAGPHEREVWPLL